MTIRFGTDGWRAVIGKDFTPENVAAMAQAFATIYPDLKEAGLPIIVGYDRRNKSKESAQLIAQVLTANGITTWLSNDYCPTPCVSWMTVEHNAAAGIMVTASHNPPIWNGIKFKESYGGAASPDYTQPIEKQIDANAAKNKTPKMVDLANNKKLNLFDPHQEYVTHLKSMVDMNAIRQSGIQVMADPMYGAGVGFFADLLGDQVTQIHTEADPNFGGLHPEPILPYVQGAIEAMKKQKGFHACLITDGDADRIGAIDENGNYITSHEIYSLLLQHVVQHRGWTGKVIKSISTTVMIDRLCAQMGLPLQVTPIGFKHISPAMNVPGILAGGEESGGIGFPKHLCERDGLFCALLLLEMMAVKNKTMGQLVTTLQKEAGPCCYRRIDITISREKIEAIKIKLATEKLETLAGQKIKKRTLIDGTHYQMEDDSWLLIRPSGTEPLLRTYAEAPTLAKVEALLSEAKNLIR